MIARRRIWTHLFMAGVASAFVAATWFTRPTPVPLPPEFLASKSPIPAEFVDDARCADCHSDVAAKFAKSGMGRAFDAWKDAEPIEDRTEGGGPVLTLDDLHYQVVIERGRMFQREFRIVDGKEIELNRREAVYVLGSGTKGRGYLASVNGYLTALPLSWYSNRKAWDFSPGYRQFNVRFDRVIQRGCMACHNSTVGTLPGTVNGYLEPLPAGIGCQRCHGPGAEHVAFHERSASGTDPMTRISKLEPRLQNDICLQCHLLTDETFFRGDCGSFKPGRRLSDCRADFFSVKDAEVFDAVGHGPRNMASKCYTASGGKMTCILCHDPHSPASGVPRSFYNQRCSDCHQQVVCKRMVKPSESPKQGDCVSCHMPTKKADDIPHALATDHWIQVPGRKLGAPLPPPKDPAVPMAAWSERTTPIDFGVAAVRHALKSGTAEQRLQASQKLESLLTASSDPNAAAWFEVAKGYLFSGAAAKAKPALQRSLAGKPNDPTSLELLGIIQGRLGDTAGQAELLEQVLKSNPWANLSGADLVGALTRSGGERRAFELYDRYLQFHPPNPDLLMMLGDLKRRLKAPNRKAAEFYTKAARADGARADPHLALARLAKAESRFAAAAIHAKDAADRAPRDASIQAFVAECQSLAGNAAAAHSAAEKALALDPNNTEARNILRGIESIRAKSKGTN